MNNKSNKTIDKNLILVIGVNKSEYGENTYSFGTYDNIDDAEKDIGDNGAISDEYRIFTCSVVKRVKLDAKLKVIKEE